MNIFFLSWCFIEAAQQHVDRHVVKMILESAQILCTAHHIIDGPKEGLFKAAFKNHPCSVWARETSGNYNWLFGLFRELLNEYSFRYDKKHACERMIELLEHHPEKIILGDVTTPALAMPDNFKVLGDPVLSYQQYYTFGKTHLHSWKRREIPSFVNSLKKTNITNPTMANFIESAFTFTVKFAADLKAALAINPDLDIQEFTKPYFGFPTSPIVVNVSQHEKSKPAPSRIVAGVKGKAAKGGMCTATTAKGAQCSKCAKQGEVFCSIHLKTKTKDGAKTTKKVKEPTKRAVPTHTHSPDVTPVVGECEMCDTHGDGFAEREVDFKVQSDDEGDDEQSDPTYELGEDDFED